MDERKIHITELSLDEELALLPKNNKVGDDIPKLSDDAMEYMEAMAEVGNSYLDEEHLKHKLGPIMEVAGSIVAQEEGKYTPGVGILISERGLGTLLTGIVSMVVGILRSEGYAIHKEKGE